MQVGTANVSVANEVAEVQKLLRASGLTCTMHSAGTTVGELFLFFFSFGPLSCRNGLAKPAGVGWCVWVYIDIFLYIPVYHTRSYLAESELTTYGGPTEGSWDDVMKVIGQAHSLVHAQGVLRVQSSMRVGTRSVATKKEVLASAVLTVTRHRLPPGYIRRTDKKQTAEDKVKRVQDILSKDA